jgi:DNA-binding transcriptional regulator YiaG
MKNQISKQNQTSQSRKWQAHLAAQEKSGLSRTQYCRRQQISYHTFTYWRNKLSKPNGNEVTLVPITLRPKPVHTDMHGGAADLTIVLPGKISIAVGQNFSAATLNKLLTLLESR